MPQTRAPPSTANSQTDRPPFWEGSTIEGSLASDTASNTDASIGEPSRYHLPAPEPNYRQREITRHRPSRPVTLSQDQQPPFIIGSAGVIGNPPNALSKRASTPDGKNYYGSLKTVPAPSSDQCSEDSLYQTSPEKTSPSTKRLQRGPKLPLRTSRRGSSTRSVAYPTEEGHSPHPKGQVYQNTGGENVPHNGHAKAKAREPAQSTNIADLDAALVDHPDSDGSADRQLTPKAAGKARPQVARQLFSSSGTHKHKLHENVMSWQDAEKPPQPSSKKRPFELDYDDKALSSMNYAELKEQPFDYDPTQAEVSSEDAPPRGTLPEKLEHFLEKDQATQVDFFTGMPVKDWEDSGDWILDRFGDVMRRLREARQNKRATVEKFENEIAERQAAVSSKIQGIDQRLAELKSQGEGLMQGSQADCDKEW